MDTTRQQEGDWDSETRRHIMDILQVMFDPWASFANQHEDYIERGLARLSLSLTEALSPHAVISAQWSKLPLLEEADIQDIGVEGSRQALEDESSYANLPQINGDGYYRMPGGRNGLFYVDVKGQPLALDIPNLAEKGVLFRVLDALDRIEVYSQDRKLAGVLVRKSGASEYQSETKNIRILPKLQPSVAHLRPETTLDYQNLRALAAQLSYLQKNGRGYSVIDFLETEPASETNKVHMDVARGVIYLAPSLVGHEAEAAAQVDLAMRLADPIVRLEWLIMEMREFALFPEIETGKTLSEKTGIEFNRENPLPELLPEADSSILSFWPPEQLSLYEKLRQQTQAQHEKLRLMRQMEIQYLRNAARYNPEKKGLNHSRFRAWIGKVLNQSKEDFYFLFMDKGTQSQATRLDYIKWEENKTHTYRPFSGIGIATAEHFSKDPQGRFQLGRSGRNLDPARYLFIRYPHPDIKDSTLVDVFDLKSGALIQDSQIEFERLRAEVTAALDQLIRQADNKEETRMNLHGLQNRLERFVEDLLFSDNFSAAYLKEHSREELDKFLLKTRAEVLGVFNQLLATVLNSKDYSNALNFAVLEMILAYVAREGADQALFYAHKLRSAYALQPERLLDALALYLEDHWEGFDFKPTGTSVDPNAERVQDFLNRVLLPIVEWSHGQADDLTHESFIEDIVFEFSLKQVRLAVEEQVESFLRQLPSDELRNGVLSFESRFRDQYQPVPFIFRNHAPEVTALERYVIERVFEIKQEELREITVAQASERAAYHTQYGAAEGIGASSALIEYREHSLIADAGMMIDDQNTLPSWPSFKKLPQAIFITHAHLDHVGGLIPLWKDRLQKKVPVYVTRGTYEILPTVLSAVRSQGETGGRHAFSPEDIRELMDNVYVLEIGQWYEVAPGMKAYYHGPVGHLHGAASLIVSTPDSTSFISGDLSYRSQGPVPGWQDIPEEIRKHIDRAVIESTYGMLTRKSENEEDKRFISSIASRLNRGGKVLIPAFANGRSQRALLTLLENLEKLSKGQDLKIYIDGQSAAYTKLYLKAYPDVFAPYADFIKKNVVLISDIPREAYQQRYEAMDRNEKQRTIIISSSGNASQGRSHWWAGRLANHSDNGIFFTGYMDPQEAGSVLLKFAKEAETANLTGEDPQKRYFFFEEVGLIPVLAAIDEFTLSGHIQGGELMGILETFGGALKEVIIQHGNERRRREVFDWIRENHPEWNPRLIKNGIRYQGQLPLNLTTLNERRAFFENLSAIQLSQTQPPEAPVSIPGDVEPEATVVSVESEPLEQAVQKKTAQKPGVTEITAMAVAEDNAKPDTEDLVRQLQKSKTIVNAIGKVTDNDLKILAALIDALSSDAHELVIAQSENHEEWRGKLSDAARNKLSAEFKKRGLTRSEVRTATVAGGRWKVEGYSLTTRVRQIFAEAILPSAWGAEAVRSEVRRMQEAQQMPSVFKNLSDYSVLQASAQKIAQGDLPRQLVDVRLDLPAMDELVPILALLHARTSINYVLITAFDQMSADTFAAKITEHLKRPEVLAQWGNMDLEKLGARFRIEVLASDSSQIETALRAAALEQVLAGKSRGTASAVVSLNQAMSNDLALDARRHRFLNVYTPGVMPRTAAIWLSAELLDELTEDMLARFDSQRFLLESRFQGLWSEMRQLLSVMASA